MTLGVQKPKLAKAPQKPPKAPKSSKSAKGGLCGGQGPQFDPSEIWVQIGFPWDLGGKVDQWCLPFEDLVVATQKHSGRGEKSARKAAKRAGGGPEKYAPIAFY